MKLDIKKDLKSQILHFQFGLDLGILGAKGNGNIGNWKSWKTLRVEKSGRNFAGRISKFRRYVIEVIVLDLMSLWKLGGSSAFASLVLLDVLGR